jgi:hypothetical protein
MSLSELAVWSTPAAGYFRGTVGAGKQSTLRRRRTEAAQQLARERCAGGVSMDGPDGGSKTG